MPDGADAVTIEVLSSIHDVPAQAWDACAGEDDPFTSHAFLAALEDSGSVCAGTGWLPRHLAVTRADGALVGCMPLYLKSHSYGEYVFDWGWAEAYQRAGGRYYPKLQGAIPFTPVTGRRLLLRPDTPAGTFRALVTAAIRLAERVGVSSLHITFPTGQEAAAFEPHGFLIRLGHQYHWDNRGYRSFDDFLGDLASRKRKAIRKERQSVAASGIVLRTLTGPEVDERHWDAFFRFYLDTTDRKWGYPYLNRKFFRRLGETMADRVVLVMAETQLGELVGGALNLLGARALYGRYWGCIESCRFLHFEACYYRAIEFAIERGLERVEAGAQGEHKVQRGYLPQATWSAHWIAHSGLRRAVQRFLEAERPAIEAEIREFAADSPFRRAESR
jgi:predicted N-acyltransferase